MDYTVTKIKCDNCDKVLTPQEPCLEVIQNKWVNGYYTVESESIYFCQKCCQHGISIKAKDGGE